MIRRIERTKVYQCRMLTLTPDVSDSRDRGKNVCSRDKLPVMGRFGELERSGRKERGTFGEGAIDCRIIE